MVRATLIICGTLVMTASPSWANKPLTQALQAARRVRTEYKNLRYRHPYVSLAKGRAILDVTRTKVDRGRVQRFLANAFAEDKSRPFGTPHLPHAKALDLIPEKIVVVGDPARRLFRGAGYKLTNYPTNGEMARRQASKWRSRRRDGGR